MSKALTKADIARELLIRRRARSSILDYANAIEIPGKPTTDDPDTEFFEPIESTMALHHRLILTKIDETSKTKNGRLMIFMPPGSAKALALDTPIPTPTGWTMMGSLRVGDKVFDEHGNACNVIRVSPIWKDRPVYSVITECGDEIIADEEHEWLVSWSEDDGDPVFKIQETVELLAGSYVFRRNPFVERAKIPQNANLAKYAQLEIKYHGVADTVCIEVDSESHLFLAGKSMTPTHNSTMASVVFPSMYLGATPNRKMILASYGADLARKMGRRTRSIIMQPRYKNIFDVEMSKTSFATNNFTLSNKSEYMAVGLGGGVTGNRANCLVGSTLIHTDMGLLPISAIVEDHLKPRILSYNTTRKRLEYSHIVATIKHVPQKVMRIYFKSKEILDVTYDHKIWSENQWVEARSLCIGQSVLRVVDGKSVEDVQDNPQRVVKRYAVIPDEILLIDQLSIRRVVYDIQIYGTECFFANSILAHNCIIIDDPVRGREAADSPVERDKTYEAYKSDLCTRLLPGGSIVLIQCMVGSTKVLMADGSERTLKDIRPGDIVATYTRGGLDTAVVLNWANQGSDCVFKIKTESGIIVEANKRHPFLVDRDGVHTWIKLKNLRIGDKMIRVNHRGVNGVESHVTMRGVKTPQKQKASVIRTIIKRDGHPDIAHHHVITTHAEKRISGIDTELTPQSIGNYIANKTGYAQSVNKSQGKMYAPIGEVSYAWITTTPQEKSVACSAMTAISQSDTVKQQKSSFSLRNTYEILSDPIIEIIESRRQDVYDIQISETENFIANGLISHNTRWHEDDLAGRILPEEWNGESGRILCKDGAYWEVLCLQAKCEKEDDPLGRNIGEYIWPEWFDAEHWVPFESDLRTWASLFQQLPRPAEGTLFKIDDLLHDRLPVPYPIHCDTVFAVIDSALKAGDRHDGTAVCYFSRSRFSGHPLIILDWEILKIEADLLIDWLPNVLRRCDELAKICRARQGSAGALVEDKGSGIALLQHAKRKGLLARPLASELSAMSKDSRGVSVAGYVVQGYVKISEHAYNKRVLYNTREQNHFLSQVGGYQLGILNQADDLYDTFVYGVSIGVGDAKGF